MLFSQEQRNYRISNYPITPSLTVVNLRQETDLRNTYKELVVCSVPPHNLMQPQCSLQFRDRKICPHHLLSGLIMNKYIYCTYPFSFKRDANIIFKNAKDCLAFSHMYMIHLKILMQKAVYPMVLYHSPFKLACSRESFLSRAQALRLNDFCIEGTT